MRGLSVVFGFVLGSLGIGGWLAAQGVAATGFGSRAGVRSPHALASSCQPSWQATFGGEPGANFLVYASAIFDDGNGPALYLGGAFQTAGGVLASHVARWDGSHWTALGSGTNGDVDSLAVFDDGNGAALYAGGEFTVAGGLPANRIAKWNGSSWSPLGSGVGGTSTRVQALAVFDDGSGPALYAGGGFTTAGGTPASRVAKWNGSSWSALGSGVNNQVSALAVYDDGAGARLYAGGLFTSAGGATASRIASWNGAAWSAVGGGLINGADGCRSLVVFDPGSGPRLYAGGDFNTAGSTSANRVASWNGSSWAALGTGVSGGLVAEVMALVVHDDGTGPALYVGGTYASAGGVAASSVAKWDGSSWSALGSGLSDPVQPEVTTLASFDDGSGPALHVAGGFSKAGALDANNVARWRGSTWSALRSGPLGLNSSVRALEVYDDGSGAALYVGGDFTSTGSITAKGIAKWDGASWSPLAPLYSETRVGALAVFDDGAGPALYAEVFPGAAPMVVARWNGSSWSVDPGAPASGATAFLVHDDGGGAALYACGSGGVSRRNGSGTSWPFLGSLRGDVRALVVFDDGTGPALYAGGDFTLSSVFGSPRRSVARWDGSSWDGGVGQGLPDKAFALAVFDDGSGAALYAGTSSAGLWRRSGSSWSLVGGGLHVEVRSLAVFDDGSGRALYAGNGDGVFRHEGSSLSLLGSGTAGSFFDHGGVYALKTFDDGSGPALYVGGGFGSVPDSGDSFLARWSGCPDSLAPEISCPPSVHAIAPFGATGKVVSFTVTALDNLDASPTVVCVPASGSFFPLGTTMVSCTATDDLGNQSTCQFPLIVKERTRREAR